MNIVKQAQNSGENMVMIGITGSGKETMSEALLDLALKAGGRARVIVICDCPEVACAQR